MLHAPVERPANIETTVAGAAFLAGLATGFWNSLDDVAATWERERTFEPTMDDAKRETLRAGWNEAVARSLSSFPARG